MEGLRRGELFFRISAPPRFFRSLFPDFLSYPFHLSGLLTILIELSPVRPRAGHSAKAALSTFFM